MSWRLLGRFIPLVLALVAGLAQPLRLAAADVDFTRDIRPILVDRCFRCHSSLKQEANLRLDLPDEISKGGDGGPIVVPGHSGDSRLLVTDLHATVLHQLGLDGARLRVPGRPRLEMDLGKPIHEILS